MKWLKSKLRGVSGMGRSDSNNNSRNQLPRFQDSDSSNNIDYNFRFRQKVGVTDELTNYSNSSPKNKKNDQNGYELQEIEGGGGYNNLRNQKMPNAHTRYGGIINLTNGNKQHQSAQQSQRKLGSIYNLKQVSLPDDFSGRVLKLEMTIEKGALFATIDDIKNLMDLYTQAVEFYNSTQQAERQKYYEQKMQKLLDSPGVKKIYAHQSQIEIKQQKKKDLGISSSPEEEKKQDKTIAIQVTKSMGELLLQNEKRKSKITMNATIYQVEKEQESQIVQTATIDLIAEAQRQRDTATRVLNNDKIQQKESIQQRLAERRKRTSSKHKFNSTTLQSSESLQAKVNLIQNRDVQKGNMAGTVIVSQVKEQDDLVGSPVKQGISPAFQGMSQENFQLKAKLIDKNYSAQKPKGGEGDYIKNLLNKNASFFGKSTSSSNFGGNQSIPSFGQSKIGSGTSQISGRRSTTTAGGGLASRFSLALSRIFDNNTEAGDISQSLGLDDVNEIQALIDELNQHTDLTTKLSNQSKICNIFKQNGQVSKNSVLQKKFESSLRNMDPELQKLLEECKDKLEKLQEEKEQSIDEFLEQHTDDRIMTQKKIEKEYKKKIQEIESQINQIEQDETKQKEIEELQNKKEETQQKMQQTIEEIKKDFEVQKRNNLQQIKDKFNKLGEAVKVDPIKLKGLLEKKRMQEPERTLSFDAEVPMLN